MNDRYTQCTDYFTIYKDTDAKVLWEQLGAAIPYGDDSNPGVGTLAGWLQTNVQEKLGNYVEELKTARDGLMDKWTGEGATEFSDRIDKVVEFANNFKEDANNLKLGLDTVAAEIQTAQDTASDPDNVPDAWDFAVAGFTASGGNFAVAGASAAYGWITGDDREKEAHENLARVMAGLSNEYDVTGASISPQTERPEGLPTDADSPTVTPTPTPPSSTPSGSGDTNAPQDPDTQQPDNGGENEPPDDTGDYPPPDPPDGDGGSGGESPDTDGLQSGGGLGAGGGLAGGAAGPGAMGGAAAAPGAGGAGGVPVASGGAPGSSNPAAGRPAPTPATGGARPGMVGSPRQTGDEEPDDRDTWLLEDEMVWDDGDFRPPPVLK